MIEDFAMKAQPNYNVPEDFGSNMSNITINRIRKAVLLQGDPNLFLRHTNKCTEGQQKKQGRGKATIQSLY